MLQPRILREGQNVFEVIHTISTIAVEMCAYLCMYKSSIREDFVLSESSWPVEFYIIPDEVAFIPAYKCIDIY